MSGDLNWDFLAELHAHHSSAVAVTSASGESGAIMNTKCTRDRAAFCCAVLGVAWCKTEPQGLATTAYYITRSPTCFCCVCSCSSNFPRKEVHLRFNFLSA